CRKAPNSGAGTVLLYGATSTPISPLWPASTRPCGWTHTIGLTNPTFTTAITSYPIRQQSLPNDLSEKFSRAFSPTSDWLSDRPGAEASLGRARPPNARTGRLGGLGGVDGLRSGRP